MPRSYFFKDNKPQKWTFEEILKITNPLCLTNIQMAEIFKHTHQPSSN